MDAHSAPRCIDSMIDGYLFILEDLIWLCGGVAMENK